MIQPGKSLLKFEFQSQTLKMTSQAELFLYPDKQGTFLEDTMAKTFSTNNNKDKDNSQKNHCQNNLYSNINGT